VHAIFSRADHGACVSYRNAPGNKFQTATRQKNNVSENKKAGDAGRSNFVSSVRFMSLVRNDESTSWRTFRMIAWGGASRGPCLTAAAL
jgi:hypothetical protein